MKNETVESDRILKAAAAFAALGSEQRLQVLRSIVRAGPDGVSIGELGLRCGVTGSTLTHHMNILRTAGLVEQSRQGRSIICVAAAYDEMQSLSDFLLSECCADSPSGTHNKEHSHG